MVPGDTLDLWAAAQGGGTGPGPCRYQTSRDLAISGLSVKRRVRPPFQACVAQNVSDVAHVQRLPVIRTQNAPIP